MKKILNILRNIIVTIYVVMIIFITVCLLSFNDYKVATFSSTTILPIIDDDLGDLANVGDLLIIEKDPISKIKEGDIVFFYYTEFGNTTINFAKVTEVMPSGQAGSLKVEGDYVISYASELIGKKDSTTTISNLGNVIHYLESKWGFLFLGVFPSIIVFLYTAYSVFMEVTVGDEEDDEEDEKASKKKSKKKLNDDSNKEDNVKKQNDVDEKVLIQEEVNSEEKEEVKEEIKENVEENKNIVEDKVEQEKKEVKQDILEGSQKENEPKEKQDIVSNSIVENKIEERKNTLTEAQKRALIEAKLKSMTPEEKRALIEAKKRKLEEEKRKNNN